MNPDIRVIIEFVEGRIDPKQFESYLYQSPSIESLFSDDEDCIYKNKYFKLLAENYKSAGGVLDSHGFLCDWLNKKHIPHQPTQKYSKLFNLILRSQPEWLSVDPEYIQTNFLNKHPKATLSELRKWLLDQFKYIKSPPKWLQDADWPIADNIPLIF